LIIRHSPFVNRIIPPLLVFGLALLPRLWALDRFVTADEAKWVYRSAQFWGALLRGDFAATSVNLTPGVTTTWLGGLGLAVFHRLHAAELGGLPLAEWLATLPQFRADLPVLVAARWPAALASALAVVAVYGLARALFNPTVGLLAGILLALDPHTLALSRILGHDAPAAMFAGLSLLALLLALKRADPARGGGWLWFGLSGVCAGLAALSKAPALFLVPFAGLLFLSRVGRNRAAFRFWLARFAVWGAAGYLAFVIFWPAAWVSPLARPWSVVQNAFLSATDTDEAAAEGYWRVPDLGPLYYVVTGGFKLSPLVLAGAALALLLGGLNRRRQSNPPPLLDSPGFWLALFALLFGAFMTLGEKRSARYILPAFPALVVLAALGWHHLLALAAGSFRAARPLFAAILAAAALLILWPAAPYYFDYFNPLLGGGVVAPRLMKIGWGEGLDQVGRFLQRELPGRRVGTPYASTVAPFFAGRLSGVTGDQLDALVLYRKQVQSGAPSPAFVRYFEQETPLFAVNLAGVHYADVFAGPALRAAEDSAASAGPPGARPVLYRPRSPVGRIGQTLAVDVVWSLDVNDAPGAEPVSLGLYPAAGTQGTISTQNPDTALAESSAALEPLGNGLAVSRHTLAVPPDVPRGEYELRLGGARLGPVELRNFAPPENLGDVRDVVFGGQLALVGYQFTPTEDFVGVTAAWRAEKSGLPDYTVFAHLLNADTGERVAGFDAQPGGGAWPTSRWAAGEVVTDEWLIALPPDLPPGPYVAVVGVYRPATGERLRRANGEDFWMVPFTFVWNGSR